MGSQDLTDILRTAFVGLDWKERMLKVLQLHGLENLLPLSFHHRSLQNTSVLPVLFCLVKLDEPCLSSYYLWDQDACFDQKCFYKPLLIVNTQYKLHKGPNSVSRTHEKVAEKWISKHSHLCIWIIRQCLLLTCPNIMLIQMTG